MDGELFSWIGSLSLSCSLRADRVGYLSWNSITCLAGKRALNNLASSCGACFRFLFCLTCFILVSSAVQQYFFYCCFLTLEKLKIANKTSCDKGERFLRGLLFKYLLCVCCLELLNMHWKSDFCSAFCVDLGHFIPSLCRAEQIGRSVRSFEAPGVVYHPGRTFVVNLPLSSASSEPPNKISASAAACCSTSVHKQL